MKTSLDWKDSKPSGDIKPKIKDRDAPKRSSEHIDKEYFRSIKKTRRRRNRKLCTKCDRPSFDLRGMLELKREFDTFRWRFNNRRYQNSGSHSNYRRRWKKVSDAPHRDERTQAVQHHNSTTNDSELKKIHESLKNMEIDE